MVDPISAQLTQQPQLMRVMRAGGRETGEVRSQHVHPPAARAPGGEAGDQGLVLLQCFHGCFQVVFSVHKDTRVARGEFSCYRRAAAGGHVWLGLGLEGLVFVAACATTVT